MPIPRHEHGKESLLRPTLVFILSNKATLFFIEGQRTGWRHEHTQPKFCRRAKEYGSKTMLVMQILLGVDSLSSRDQHRAGPN